MQYNKKSVEDIDVSGKKVIVRCDFNVPQDENGNITDDKRIRASLETINYLLSHNAAVILCSHLGRPKGEVNMKYSLAPVAKRLSELLGQEVKLAKDVVGEDAKKLAAEVKPGEAVLLENVRFEKGETKNDAVLAKAMADMAEIYVNDAFGTAHRAHASTALIADKFPHDKMFGYVMENELQAVDRLMLNPRRPFAAIIGGSKVSTKISILENLMEKVDSIVIGGGMSYTFAAAQGGKVGNSLCEPEMFPTALEIVKKAEERGVKLVFSPDALIADKFAEDADTRQAPVNDIPDGWMGLDIGEEGKKTFREHILGCKTILWNGPVGVFEMDKFATGSKAVAEAIAEATSKGAFSLIGGGDSVACINKFSLADKVSYVSTGGGALLEYIEGKELPGVAAIRK